MIGIRPSPRNTAVVVNVNVNGRCPVRRYSRGRDDLDCDPDGDPGGWVLLLHGRCRRLSMIQKRLVGRVRNEKMGVHMDDGAVMRGGGLEVTGNHCYLPF